VCENVFIIHSSKKWPDAHSLAHGPHRLLHNILNDCTMYLSKLFQSVKKCTELSYLGDFEHHLTVQCITVSHLLVMNKLR
jgi:hypothetical protein